MTLDGLLAFGGILLAIIAIADPVQRRSILMFTPRVSLLLALGSAILIVMFMRFAELWDIPLSKCLEYSLYAFTIIVPIGVTVWGALCWQRAVLNEKDAQTFAGILDATIKEAKYDEAERILKRNSTRLKMLPISILHRVFDRKMVRAMLDARSVLHFEWLASPDILKRDKESRSMFIDNVVRELLLSPNSPWRSAVLSEYGGHDSWAYLGEEQRIVESTLQNPEWYVTRWAHYPLVITAVEVIKSGKLDVDYNRTWPRYDSRQGISPRANCPVFLAAKMEVLAIKAAVEERSDDKDLYVSDLWNIFEAIRDHSVYAPAVWENDRINSEYPTPYAYLLHEIFYDLRDLIEESLRSSVENDRTQCASKISPPVGIDRQLALTWSFCVWGMAHAEGNVAEDFRIGMIKGYLDLLLKMHCQPSEIFGPCSDDVVGMEPWCDLFLEEIKQRFSNREKESLERAFSGLDRGKEYVANGREWLSKQLGLSVK